MAMSEMDDSEQEDLPNSSMDSSEDEKCDIDFDDLDPQPSKPLGGNKKCQFEFPSASISALQKMQYRAFNSLLQQR